MYDANTHTASTASNPPARFLPNHILTSRIAEKQAEYENLVQLRDLSAALATQMEGLEAKLQCLADGTESTPRTHPLPYCPVWLGAWANGRCCGCPGELAEYFPRD